MPLVPATSTTLLRDLTDAQSARWAEFFARYVPMMEAYLTSRFPKLEADDLIQETFVALVEKLPDYRYSPDETGYFRNYLTGILRHRALSGVEKERRRRALAASVGREPAATACEDDEESAYREAILKIAVAQFLADRTVASRTREIFRRTALAGEPPAVVADSLKMERHAVDQAKSRSMARVRELVERLEAVDDGR